MINYYDTRTFKVWNYKYLNEEPQKIIIDALIVLTCNYSADRKKAAILLLKALLKKAFLKHLLEDPSLYPEDKNDYRVKEWTKKIKEKGICEKCGCKENLEAHHIIEWSVYPQGRIDLSNGMCLCLRCHTNEHRFENVFYMMKAKQEKVR